MQQVVPGVFLGSVADFGNQSVLQANGIELAIIAHGFKGFPHVGPQIGAAAFHVDTEGNSPQWFVRGVVDLLIRAYGSKTFAIFDVAGGMVSASYLLACAFAENQSTSFNAGLTWLQGKVADALPTDGQITQGQGLWP